jgi:hypothetical protein
MRVISDSSRGALVFIFAWHELTSRCHPIVISWRRIELWVLLRRTPLTLGSRKCPRCNDSMRLPQCSVVSALRRRDQVSLCRVSARPVLCPLWTISPGARALTWHLIHLHGRVVHEMEELMLEARATTKGGGTCGWRYAAFGPGLRVNSQGM